MVLKIFTQPSCPACPSAKELGKKVEKYIKVEYFDFSEPEGLAEATFYGVMATPTLILVENKDKNLRHSSKNLDSRSARIKIKKTWVGTPDEKEILDKMKE